MAVTLQFMDGFDHYGTAQLGRKWVVSGLAATIDAGTGRNGDNCLKAYGGSTSLSVAFPSQVAWMVSFAFRPDSLANDYDVIRIQDGATLHTSLRLSATNVLYVTRNGTSLGTSGSFTLATGQWYHIAFACSIADAGGMYDVWVNGVKVITGTGDTRNAGNASASTVVLGCFAAGKTFYYDDVAIFSGPSYTDADYPGDLKVVALLPNGNGSYSQFTGSDGNSTDNYLLVDDPAASVDDATTTVSGTLNQIDSYAFPDLVGSPTVKGVQVNLMATKDDTGTRQIDAFVKNGASEAVSGAGSQTLSYGSYADQRFMMAVNPLTGAPWTAADVNACEFGVKVVI